MRGFVAAVGSASAALALVLGASALGADDKPAPSPAPVAAPQLTGRYKLNPAESDDARAKFREAMAQRRGDDEGGSGGGGGGYGRHHGGGGFGGGGMGGGFGGGGGRRGGWGGGGQSDSRRAGMRAAMDEAMDAGSVLTITQKDPEVVITYDDGRVLQLYADNRKVKADGDAPERQSYWEGEKLVSEVQVKNGPKIRESFVLDPATHALNSYVRLQLPMSDQPIIIHRLYDAAPPEGVGSAPLEGVGVTVTPDSAPAASPSPAASPAP